MFEVTKFVKAFQRSFPWRNSVKSTTPPLCLSDLSKPLADGVRKDTAPSSVYVELQVLALSSFSRFIVVTKFINYIRRIEHMMSTNRK